MRVDVADTESEQLMPRDKVQNFVVCDDHCLGHFSHRDQYGLTLPKTTKCKLSNDERVDEDTSLLEEGA